MTVSSAVNNKKIWLVFGLVFCWKIALLVFTAQPIPSNDAFFYDGAVVNYLQNGGYYNPSLVLALPTSGSQVFCAYPPLYMVVLLGWMAMFGTSVISAMVLHLVLFGIYALILLAIFRRLQTPIWCVVIAGVYLLLITFHDRPDSLAYVFGMGAIYAWIRSRKILGGKESPMWAWVMAGLVVLCLATSLQIGTLYFFWMWVGMAAATLLGNERFPRGPMIAMCLIPAALVVFVKLAYPHLWAGFMEHAVQVPSLTGLRRLHADEFLKVLRTVPGIILAALLLPWAWLKQRRDFESPVAVRHELVLVPGLLTGLVVVATCLLVLVANFVVTANYLQPIVVASYLTVCGGIFGKSRILRVNVGIFLAAALLGSVRAIGMSTWGLACAADVSYTKAIQRVNSEMESCMGGSTVVMSSAYLYEAARHKNVRWIHSDWMRKAKGGPYVTDLEAFKALTPEKLILTQFDYFRRYKQILEDAKSDPRIQDIKIENMAKTPAPDSIPLTHQVVQHISWAPVIVKISWQGRGGNIK